MSGDRAPPFRKRRPFPRRVAECIEPLTKPVFQSHGFAEVRIIRDWALIVGPELARQATPHRLSFARGKNSDGTLTVLASSAAATLLQHMEPLILEKLATHFGYRAVTKLRIEHRAAPAPEIAPAPPQPKPPRAAATLPAPVADEELRDALTRLAQALQRADG